MLGPIFCSTVSTFDFDVRSGSGLTITARGVPVVRGSWFQYYEPGWTKGYYSSMYQPATVKRIDVDTMSVEFAGAEGRVAGKTTYHRDGDRLVVQYHFEWSGDAPALVENCVGQVWAPAFAQGTVKLDGQPGRNLATTPEPKDDSNRRRLGPDATTIQFESPFAGLTTTSSTRLMAFDARNGYRQEFAEGKRLFWMGAESLAVAKGKPADMTVEWRLTPSAAATAPAAEVKLSGKATADVYRLPDERLPLVPQPSEAKLDYDHPIEFSLRHRFPAGRFRFYDDLVRAVRRRFDLPAPTDRDPIVDVDGGISRLDLVPGGYRIEIKDHAVSVLGQADEGLRVAVERVAQLIFTKNGKLYLPRGVIVDQPKTSFRGVHLFVGRNAVDFQRRLWERALRPLGFNTVVLQCERTKWDALEGAHSNISMEKADLKRLFDQYRSMGIDPIPLIQSLGHMEWFFAQGKRLDLAFNPSKPYAIDPRKPEARDKIAQIWDEAIGLLHPKTVHFGLDEIDMIGHDRHDPKLVTEMWRTQLPFLGDVAKRHGVQMMLWGDKALAPGEAPDAALGDDKTEAEARRRAIPRGALIADWHYKPDPRPEAFYPTLQLWKREGFNPIASTWYRPENVRGFGLAATFENCGLLQTTWAGYESDEEAMLRAMNQFSAMVLAADYAWSGRTDRLDQLGYSPAEVLRRMYFGRPLPTRPLSGVTFGSAEEIRVEGLAFRPFAKPYALASAIAPNADQASSLGFSIASPASEVGLLIDVAQACDEDDPVAELTVVDDRGAAVVTPWRYGRQVREATDVTPNSITPRVNGLSAVHLVSTTGRPIVRIDVRPLSVYAGLRVHAVTTIPFRDKSSARRK